MKKQISILIVIALCLALCCGLSGCSHPTASVASSLDIDESFAGSRTVSVIYPLSVKIDSLKDAIIADDPTGDIDGVAFTYAGVEEDGYHFELVLTFSDKAQYEDQVAALIGRSTSVFLSRKDTYLTHGTRMAEDFDVSDLIAWMISDTAACSDTKNLTFDVSSTVRIGSDSYSTASTASINECTGSAIDAIAIETSNDKAGKFSRTFRFDIPNATYTEDQAAIKAYFLTNTLPESKYAGWTSKGSEMQYTVIYEELSIEKLQEVTALLLDTDSASVFYGDRDNASTPLAEGLVFEENLDTFSFIGGQGGFPVMEYAYSLPLNTTYGDGQVFRDGQWVSDGKWENDLYTVTLQNGSARLRIPDGIQYSVSGINFSLETLGKSTFRRSTDFLYPKTDGQAAADYAVRYFASKDVACEQSETDANIVCRVAFEGTVDEITEQLVSVFGSGNFMAYEAHKGAFDLSTKTELTDYVNISAMLNANNAGIPMNYTVSSQGGDNIVSVAVDGAETAYTEHSRISLPIENGRATIVCNGNIPVTSAIVIYIILGLVLLTLTSFIAIKLIKPKRRRVPDPLGAPAAQEAVEEDAQEAYEPDPAVKASVTQTTTFSIFELNALVRNKKYVEEINKDVEERMRVQRIEEQKQDIRAKELEDLSRKVYGAEPDASDEADGSDAAPADAEPAAASETPAVSDIDENGGEEV